MLCHKCKTAVSQDDKVCKNCGAKVNNGSRMRKIIGSVSVCAIVVACASYIFLNQTGRIGGGKDEPTGDPDVVEATTSPDSGASETANVTPTPDLSKDMDEVWAMLEDTYKGTTQFMEDYAYVTYLSEKGYLFDLSAKRHVSIEDLTHSGKLDEKYEKEKISIFYLRPQDFVDAKEVSFGDSDVLSVFAGYETNDGVALYSDVGSGVIYREDLNKILEKYNNVHGEAIRLMKDAETYQAIVDAVVDFSSFQGTYQVRHMCSDDKYAAVVLSDEQNSSVLTGFILEKTEGKWNVVVDQFERFENEWKEVNNIVPDLSFDLLPLYSLSEAELVSPVEYAFVADSLLEKGEITEEDKPVRFVSGTKDYFYLVMKSGKAFMGIMNPGEGWSVTPISGWEETEDELAFRKPSEPPFYIILQE